MIAIGGDTLLLFAAVILNLIGFFRALMSSQRGGRASGPLWLLLVGGALLLLVFVSQLVGVVAVIGLIALVVGLGFVGMSFVR